MYIYTFFYIFYIHVAVLNAFFRPSEQFVKENIMQYLLYAFRQAYMFLFHDFTIFSWHFDYSCSVGELKS